MFDDMQGCSGGFIGQDLGSKVEVMRTETVKEPSSMSKVTSPLCTPE